MQGCEQDGEATRDLSQRESFHTEAWRGRGKKWCSQSLMRAEATEEQPPAHGSHGGTQTLPQT